MGLPDETVAEESGEDESPPGRKAKRIRTPLKEATLLAKPEEGQLKPVAVSELLSLKEQLREEQEKSKEYLNKLLYAQADFENYRKRLDQEVASRVESGKARLIQRLLTIVDELELALGAAKTVEGAKTVADGLEIVLKKFRDLLTAEGLVPIEAIGKRFDPALHEAVQRVERDDTEEGMILEEVRKGFTLEGKLIRPSIVKIAVPLIAEPDKSEISEGE